MKHYADEFEAPFGMITVAVDDNGALEWAYVSPSGKPNQGRKSMEKYLGKLEWNKKRCSHAVRQLKEYCNHERKSFGLKLILQGTPFRLRVWKELTRIPYGTTISYGEEARRIGNPKASRAVGQANHDNPIMIVVPCHRVISADGKVIGGETSVNIRELLLKHEGAL